VCYIFFLVHILTFMYCVLYLYIILVYLSFCYFIIIYIFIIIYGLRRRSIAVIAGSNPTDSRDVRLLCVLYVLSVAASAMC